MSDRGAQRAYDALTAGALEEFAADPLAVIYKRAAGYLAVFAANPLTVIYKQAAGALEEFAADPLAVIYKRTPRASASIYKR
ncbi:hypothetical protein [Halorubrum ruber]|uniref:hypothetical protein n=1 Tax=Halorubrum ruber TaxID=2982524 RepID=UPI0020138B83|nr:hypothetical protein [Halorubrum ruber]